MRIVFVSTTVDLASPKFCPAIAILSALARREGHETRLLLLTDRAGLDAAPARLLEAGADLVAFSVTTPQWPVVDGLGRAYRAAGGRARTLLGGIHPTLEPEEVLAAPWVDAVCVGEGEEAFVEYLAALGAGREPEGIANLWLRRRDDGAQERQPPRPALRALDALPDWDLELFGVEHFRTGSDYSFLGNAGFFPVLSGRGCPYSCTYCCNSNLLTLYAGERGPFVRKRSVEGLLGEMTRLREKYDVAGFEFWDEMLVSNDAWTEAFCRRYGEEIGLPFAACLRPEKATPPTLRLLAGAGCSMVLMGVECEDEAYRRERLNRHMSNDAIRLAFREARRLGLKTLAWNMIGLPFETPEMIRRTIAFNRELAPSIVGFSVFDPLPRTRLREVCAEAGLLTDRVVPVHSDRSRLDQPQLTAEELAACHRDFAALAAEIATEAVDWRPRAGDGAAGAVPAARASAPGADGAPGGDGGGCGADEAVAPAAAGTPVPAPPSPPPAAPRRSWWRRCLGGLRRRLDSSASTK